MTPADIATAARMWSAGADTFAIAKATGFRESVIWRCLDEIKARARELRAPIALQA